MVNGAAMAGAGWLAGSVTQSLHLFITSRQRPKFRKVVVLSSPVWVWGWLGVKQPSLNLNASVRFSDSCLADRCRSISAHWWTRIRKYNNFFADIQRSMQRFACSSLPKSHWKEAENNGWNSSDPARSAAAPDPNKLLTLTSADRWGSWTRLFHRIHLKEGEVRLHSSAPCSCFAEPCCVFIIQPRFPLWKTFLLQVLHFGTKRIHV